MSSAEYVCKVFKSIFAYRQTVWTLISLLLEEQTDQGSRCLQKWRLKSQADDKADDMSMLNYLFARYIWHKQGCGNTMPDLFSLSHFPVKFQFTCSGTRTS